MLNQTAHPDIIGLSHDSERPAGYVWRNMAIEKAEHNSWLERVYRNSFLSDLWSLLTSPTDPMTDHYISDNYSKGDQHLRVDYMRFLSKTNYG